MSPPVTYLTLTLFTGDRRLVPTALITDAVHLYVVRRFTLPTDTLMRVPVAVRVTVRETTPRFFFVGVQVAWAPMTGAPPVAPAVTVTTIFAAFLLFFTFAAVMAGAAGFVARVVSAAVAANARPATLAVPSRYPVRRAVTVATADWLGASPVTASV